MVDDALDEYIRDRPGWSQPRKANNRTSLSWRRNVVSQEQRQILLWRSPYGYVVRVSDSKEHAGNFSDMREAVAFAEKLSGVAP